MDTIEQIETDILILGSGLAGMRAAISALNTRVGLSVFVVSGTRGPCGSSFANRHNQLGMQVCLSDKERDDFFNEAVAIAPPGYIDPELVKTLAEEGEARFHDLNNLGLRFKRDSLGNLFRVSGCFSPKHKRAFILTDLRSAFECFRRYVISLGGLFLERWRLQDLIVAKDRDGHHVCGSLLLNRNNRKQIIVKAKSTVVATGGVAGLFPLNIAGPGVSGFTAGLLKRVGVRFVNMTYQQFMWYRLRQRRFWPVQLLAKSGHRLYRESGEVVTLPKEFVSFVEDRNQHCPVSYGQPDESFDHYLIKCLSARGWIDVVDPDNSRYKVGLMAQAGNGGVVIDRNGRTGVSGLFACGECAGGMHGANRIGGAMVLATQVFGNRAGISAAIDALKNSFLKNRMFDSVKKTVLDRQIMDNREWRDGLTRLRRGLQKYALPGSQMDTDMFIRECKERLKFARDWRFQQALETVSLICGVNE